MTMVMSFLDKCRKIYFFKILIVYDDVELYKHFNLFGGVGSIPTSDTKLRINTISFLTVFRVPILSANDPVSCGTELYQRSFFQFDSFNEL